MIDLRHLKTLAALKKTGSLVEAAECVHLTQSALSHQIKDLEERIGCSLFVRKTKPLRFTMAGERIVKLAETVLPLIHSTERELAKLTHGEAGRLYISVECHSCFDWLMPTLNKFRDNWPEVELDLMSGFNFAPIPALARGDIDLVITSDPEPVSGISFTPLFQYESLLAMSKHHPLTQKEFITPEDLQSETLITYPVDTDRLDVFQHFLDPADIEPQHIRTAELTVMMIQLIASGRGVGALPIWALSEYVRQDYITTRPLGANGVWATLYAATRTEQLEYPYFTDFLQCAKRSCFTHLDGIEPTANHKDETNLEPEIIGN